MSNLSKLSACTLAVFVTWSSTAQAQAPVAPAVQPNTLWRFIGIPQGIQKIRDVTTNRRGNRPRLERKPPMTRIGDPANLASDNPAIKAAAEIKTAEDKKKQKIKAIKYLSTIGCGCYDKDGKITEALLAATDDCTPDVRMAAVEAIYDAASGECCRSCGSTSCCNEDVGKRLSEIAYERDDNGCPLEPNADIRAAAKRALCQCCPNRVPAGLIEEDYSDVEANEPAAEGDREPEEAPIGESGEGDEDAIGESGDEQAGEVDAGADEDIKVESNSDELQLNRPADDDQASAATLGNPVVAIPAAIRPEMTFAEAITAEAHRITSENSVAERYSNEPMVIKPTKVLRIGGMEIKPVKIEPVSFQGRDATEPVAPVIESATPQATSPPARSIRPQSFKPVGGKITAIDHNSGELLVRADQIRHVKPNGTVDVFHRYLTGERMVGQLKVKQVGSKMVKAKVIGMPNIARMHVGDRVILR